MSHNALLQNIGRTLLISPILCMNDNKLHGAVIGYMYDDPDPNTFYYSQKTSCNADEHFKLMLGP